MMSRFDSRYGYSPPRRTFARTPPWRFRRSTSSKTDSDDSDDTWYDARPGLLNTLPKFYTSDSSDLPGFHRVDDKKKRTVPPPPEGFDVVKKLGQGGEGAADIIRRKTDDQLRVRKIFFSNETMWDGLPREVKILREKVGQHDRIVQLLDYEISLDGQLTVYYEHCGGGDLERFMDHDQGASRDVLWHVFLQMGEALAYLHQGYINDNTPTPPDWQPIVHCDFKPSNIFVRARARRYKTKLPDLVLGDFGFANPKASSQEGGTPNYSPPEYPNNTSAGDIWALGATIHEMAHSFTPLRKPPQRFDKGRKAWLQQPNARKPTPLQPFYGRKLNHYMMRCLEMEAHKRPTGPDLVRSIRRNYPEK